MTPQRIFVGETQQPVVIVDGMTGAAARIVEIAAALAPFPKGPNPHYPGVRRVIEARDADALGYVTAMLRDAAHFVAGGFDCDAFDLIEASFSMVTTPPATLTPAQRVPHFDSTDPNYLAVLHYLSDTPGTAFFRQRSTGIEAVTPDNVDRFVATARAQPSDAGYIHGSNDRYEQIGMVAGKADRLVIYRGCLLHSGIIPADVPLSADPRTGRLTTNIFIGAR